MKRAGNFLLLLIGIGLIMANGMIHGRLTYRWTDQPDAMRAAAAKLAELPEDFGEWRMEESQLFDDYTLGILQCEGYVKRSYMHQKTGQLVNVAIIVGPFGPTSTHTPGICYTSRNYQIHGAAERIELSAADAALWFMTLQSTDIDTHTIRVAYAWSDGGPWSASSQPRIEYGGRPYLYKIQVAGRLSAFDPEEQDPCRSFLESFLPVLEPNLLRPQMN